VLIAYPSGIQEIEYKRLNKKRLWHLKKSLMR
jgi:hypothetical protein